jgi:hypothetical protein
MGYGSRKVSLQEAPQTSAAVLIVGGVVAGVAGGDVQRVYTVAACIPVMNLKV